MITVKFITSEDSNLPKYGTKYSSAVDLRADIDSEVRIEPFQRALIPTGLFVEIPKGYEGQIRPRSGLAWKKGLTVLNTPGTIDADYRGEIRVILINLSQQATFINPGDRIAQMAFCPVEQATWKTADKLSDTERGDGGFGHTGEN